MAVSLRPVGVEDWVRCVELQPTEEQRRRHFVAPNVFSLAQAYGEPWWEPLAVYADATLVGFVMHGRRPGGREEWILRLMIDGRYQGRGYGRAAMEALLARLRGRPGCREVRLSYDDDNEVAARLYAGLGFRPTVEREAGEVVAALALDGGEGEG